MLLVILICEIDIGIFFGKMDIWANVIREMIWIGYLCNWLLVHLVRLGN